MSKEFEVKAYIHGRFKIQDGRQLADKMAFHYIHMNNKERRAHEAVYEKAKFRFKKKELQVRKPNRMTHVQEVKYPYEQIERVYLFKEYPTIIAFCINKKSNWIALLFETSITNDAERSCRAVEEFHRSQRGTTAGDNIARGIWMDRPASYIESPPPDADRHSPGDRPLSTPPAILYNGKPDSDSDSDFPDDIESPQLRGSHRSAERPVTYTEGVGVAKAPHTLLDICYDHQRNNQLRPQNGHARSKSPRHHNKKDKGNMFKVKVLGRFSSPYQEPFSPNRAHYHLRQCMSNPSEATNDGDLSLMSDCIKLGALKNGHYDHNQLYRLLVFEDDPNTLIFGIVEKRKPMYMLLRFNSEQDKDRVVEALRHYMGPGRVPASGDRHLSGMVKGSAYSDRTSLSGRSLEQMSRTIALPTEQEVAAKQQRRASSSSRTSSAGEAQEEIVATRRVGVHAERRRSSTPPGQMTVDEEFRLLLASQRIEGENGDDRRFIDAIVVDDQLADRTTDSAMYFGEEEEEIEASVSTRSHMFMKKSSRSSSHSSLKDEHWKWVEEDTYIDYKPGVGMFESDSGPIYMYCARQVRENDYRLF